MLICQSGSHASRSHLNRSLASTLLFHQTLLPSSILAPSGLGSSSGTDSHQVIMQPSSSSTFKLLLTGDVMIGRGIDQILRRPSNPILYESCVKDARDYVALAEARNGFIPRKAPDAYPWGDALLELDRAGPDFRIINLETSVTTCEDAWPDKGINYRMHPANSGLLTAAHVDVCCLANNHVIDWGYAGLEETLRALRGRGIATCGAGEDAAEAWAPARLPLPTSRGTAATTTTRGDATTAAPALAAGEGTGSLLVFAVGMESSGVPRAWAARGGKDAAVPAAAEHGIWRHPATAACPGVALLPDLSEASVQRLAAHIARYRRSPLDRVVVSIHWGGNWVPAVPQQHRAFAHRLIDLGVVDILHGHSSHHPLPVELYKGKLILYGCGDLINDYEGIGPQPWLDHGLPRDHTCLYLVTLDNASGRVRGLDLVPMRLRRFRLEAVQDPRESYSVLKRIILKLPMTVAKPGSLPRGGISLEPSEGEDCGWSLIGGNNYEADLRPEPI